MVDTSSIWAKTGPGPTVRFHDLPILTLTISGYWFPHFNRKGCENAGTVLDERRPAVPLVISQGSYHPGFPEKLVGESDRPHLGHPWLVRKVL